MYEVWDARSGNRLAAFPSEAEALQLVREMIALSGQSEAEDLFIEAVEGEDARVLVEGPELVRRATSGASRILQVPRRVATMTFHIEFDSNRLATPLAAVNTAEAVKATKHESGPLVPGHA